MQNGFSDQLDYIMQRINVNLNYIHVGRVII